LQNKDSRFVYHIDGKAKAYKRLKYRRNKGVLLSKHQIKIKGNDLNINIKIEIKQLLKR